MRCPKCSQENSDKIVYCTRCHTPLRYICPACKNVQAHGGTCEKCGVDFNKYAAMMVFRAKDDAAAERKRTKDRTAIVRQILLLPITGGLSLFKFFAGKMRGD